MVTGNCRRVKLNEIERPRPRLRVTSPVMNLADNELISVQELCLVRLLTRTSEQLQSLDVWTPILPMTKCQPLTLFVVCWITSNGPV